MVFSKEEQEIWQKSEVMQELEKIYKQNSDISSQPIEANLPIINDENNWEDEVSNKKKLLDAVKDFEVGLKEELGQTDKPQNFEQVDTDDLSSWLELEEDESIDGNMNFDSKEISANLIGNLQKLAHYLADTKRIKEVYKVEQAINNIKIALVEDLNG